MSAEGSSVLLSSEAEAYVEALQEFDLKDVGNQRWYQQHEYVEKLNMQAIVSASAYEEEFVKEYVISYEKIPVLIRDLIVTEVWKEKVFPKFPELNLEFKVTFPIYIVLYHEATIITLLETVLFHKESCESAGDSILDLADYCVRKLAPMLDREEHDEEDTTDVNNDVSSLEELQKQNEKLRFDVAMKTISILRYISDNLNSLPLSVCNRLLNTHDLPVLLVNLYRNPPWSRQKNDNFQKYIDSKWQTVEEANRFHLTKLEGQVLITLFHLLMSEECQKKYELDTYRKNEIMKLRPFLNEVVLDQLPVLSELQRYLEQLSMMDPPQPKRDLILEQVPEIHDKLLSKYDNKWKKLAKYQHEHHFDSAKLNLLDQAKRIADTYNMDTLENFITEPPKCAACGTAASKRCSRCQNEWYCRRECQVGHWKKHKKACDLMKQVLDSEKKS